VRLETDRLLLRIPEPGDAEGYLAVFRDPEVLRFLRTGMATPADTVAGIERMRRHWERHGIGLFSAIRKEDERLLGRVGFLLWEPERWVHAMREKLEGPLELEIGWTLGSEYWNQGYATEAALACRDWALGELGWTRLVSLIARENAASIRVAEKIGESYERDIERPDLDYLIGLWSLGERIAA
jgi:[ribosomal protein S5]-alanine N-acetyltransferase